MARRVDGPGNSPEMNSTPLSKRDYHCFVSYASEDIDLARRLVDWLTASGLRVWFDKARLPAGKPVIDELTREMCNSRACLLVLTEAALSKHYVKHEVSVACTQQVTEPGFALLAVRTDPLLDPTSRFPSLQTLSWMDLPKGELTLDAARHILLSLTPPVTHAKQARHIYVSCSWGVNEEPLTQRVCAPLVERGVRLIGDAQDQGKFDRLRVQRIMSGCTGHLVILPERRPPGKTPEETYKYFLAEWEIGRTLGLARRTFCVSRSVLPPQLQAEAIEIGSASERVTFERDLVELHDETEPNEPYVFLAADHKRTGDRNEAARDIIEQVVGMECWLGRDYPSEQLREALIEKIVEANVMFADVACVRDEHTNRLRPNLNTCIEAGVAMGARRPVFVTALDPESFDPGVTDKTTQVAFMFRNSQIQWYRDHVDYLSKIHRLAMVMRRRIISDEVKVTK